jgi:isochorismate synthase
MDYPDKIELAQLQTALIRANRPFVSYRLPGHTNPVTMFGADSFQEFNTIDEVLHQKNGFVLAPFAEGKPILWLKANNVSEGFMADACWLSGLTEVNFPLEKPEISLTCKEHYKQKVQQVIDYIKKGTAGKIVISRQLLRKWPDAFQKIGLLFKYLCNVYPHAFVYVAHVPGEGIWAGASPEILLKSEKGSITTMSLSGTRKIQSGNSDWGQKEIEEHLWVSRFIAESLEKSGCSELQISPMNTVQAGAVEHLRTDYLANCENEIIPRLLNALHPTPAVCGWPTPVARQLIGEIENYDRSYYTGYLGPVEDATTFNLFVNLRCMNITASHAVVYVGGGITIDSDPETEWEETELKSRTMLGAIENLANFAD